MKKVLFFLSLLIFCSKLFAGDIHEIVFFGDSLSDNGNLYSILKVIPRSPPYYKGRFTNGPTWAELLGSHYQDKLSLPYSIYAYGGATTLLYGSPDSFIAPMSLESEVDEYYANAPLANKSSTLYVIWIGANDYLFEEPGTNDEALTTEVVAKISSVMTSLINQGAQYFLILNLPDLSKTPFSISYGDSEHLHAVSAMHNEKLAKALESLTHAMPQVKIMSVDIYGILNDLLEHAKKYNQTYKTHLSVLTRACWEGGLATPHHADQLNLQQELEKRLHGQNKNSISHLNPNTVSNYIFKMPSLREAYLNGKMQEDDDTVTSCDDPDEYLFWDLVHPTGITHHILSMLVIDILDEQAKSLLTTERG